jgi:pimeloyl-ACP methyl ester carboxylesterase
MGRKNKMKVALLLPGYLDSPDYLHLVTFEKRLKELDYVVERLDLGDLWKTGESKNYTVTHFLDQIKERVDHYKPEKPDEILLLGHSRGAFTAIIAGSRIKEVTKIIALCPPPDIKASAKKWVNQGNRTSKRDLPDKPTEYREFSIPYTYVEDSLKYSAIDEAKNIRKPLMIFIALNDEVVPPELM